MQNEVNNVIIRRYDFNKGLYYINTNEIPGELLRENMLSSHVKRSWLLWLHDTSRLSQQQNVKVKWFGIPLVFI